ncbi:MAG TPA: hypothetical protein VMX17_05470 [Candidatus Glassbacteria bacterium]|nr:hypothetical protein [Candidatus Glassbacteria bacterium]
MKNTWDILQKETYYYGVKLLDHKNCQFEYKGKIYQTLIQIKIKLIDKQIKENNILLDSLWNELSDLLQCKKEIDSSVGIDIRLINLFVNSLKDIDTLARLMCSASDRCKQNLIKIGFFKNLKLALNTDYIDFSKDVILSVPDYKLCLDWIIRKNCILSYIKKLLRFVVSGQVFSSKDVVKLARGVAGPWSNLDLPMLERAFEWQDISDEVAGRQKDKQQQRRYRKGFENYNGEKVGEGYYWRELRNEPYSWYDRDTEDPYPSRSTLSKW